MSVKGLVQAAESTASAADRLGAAFARQLASVLRETERRLVGLVQEVADGSRTAIVRAARANRTRRELRAALEDSGYDQMAASAYGDRLNGLVDHVLATRRIAKQVEALGGAMDSKLEALRVLHEMDLLDEGEALSQELWRAVARGVIGGRPAPAILDDLSEILDVSEPHLQTLYDTSVSIFGRQVEALHADPAPDTPFLYMGPADKKTRPFCRARVGKAFTREQIDAMDNGQIDNVFLTGGGYNCRHTWVEISKFSELIDLVGTDQRVPEVEAQLQAAA